MVGLISLSVCMFSQTKATTTKIAQSKTSANNMQSVIVIIDDYQCGEGCSFNVKKENGKYFEQSFDFKYAKDGSIIINPEAKDLLLRSKNGDYILNPKYKGKKAKLICIKEKTDCP